MRLSLIHALVIAICAFLFHRHLAASETECRSYKDLLNTTYLEENDLVFASWIVDGFDTQIVIVNGDGYFESGNFAGIAGIVDPSKHERSIPGMLKINSPKLLMLDANNFVVVFFENLELDKSKIGAVKFHVGIKIGDVSKKLDIRHETLSLRKNKYENNKQRSGDMLSFVTVEGGMSLVETLECDYLWSGTKTSNHSSKCDNSNAGSCTHEVDVKEQKKYCLGDVAKTEEYLALVRLNDMEPPLYHFLAHCNSFREELIPADKIVKLDNGKKVKHYLKIAANDDKPDIVHRRTDICFEMPPDHRYGLIWDKKWVIGGDAPICQPIIIEVAPPPPTTTAVPCPPESPVQTRWAFALACLCAIIISFLCVSLISMERAGKRRRAKARMAMKHQAGLAPETSVMTTCQSEYGTNVTRSEYTVNA